MEKEIDEEISLKLDEAIKTLRRSKSFSGNIRRRLLENMDCYLRGYTNIAIKDNYLSFSSGNKEFIFSYNKDGFTIDYDNLFEDNRNKIVLSTGQNSIIYLSGNIKNDKKGKTYKEEKLSYDLLDNFIDYSETEKSYIFSVSDKEDQLSHTNAKKTMIKNTKYLIKGNTIIKNISLWNESGQKTFSEICGDFNPYGYINDLPKELKRKQYK